jgi:hypothetical protein
VVERAVRLIEHNGERFAKTIRAGPAAVGRLVLAPDASDETVRLERAIRTWPDDDSTRAVLARTNRELLPAVVVALGLGLPFRAPRIELLLDSPHIDELLQAAVDIARPGEPLLILLGRVRDGAADDPVKAGLATAMLGDLSQQGVRLRTFKAVGASVSGVLDPRLDGWQVEPNNVLGRWEKPRQCGPDRQHGARHPK